MSWNHHQFCDGITQATESIYASLQANNADIEAHIATLKAALAR